jgi:hypothetical protein
LRMSFPMLTISTCLPRLAISQPCLLILLSDASYVCNRAENKILF